MEEQFYSAASALSWLFQWVIWPFYAGRMASYRFMASLSVFAEAQQVRAEVDRFHAVVGAAQAAEVELADALAGLNTEPAKRLAAESFEHTLQRMSDTFRQPCAW